MKFRTSVVCLLAASLGACSVATGAAVGTAKIAGGVAVTGAKATAQGVGAGAQAVTNAATPDVSDRTLAHRAALATGEDRRSIAVADRYTDGARTDFMATGASGLTYRCAVVEIDEIVSDASCVPAVVPRAAQ